jgi:hypothetical protein
LQDLDIECRSFSVRVDSDFPAMSPRDLGRNVQSKSQTAFADEHAPNSLSDVVFVDRRGSQ